MVKILSKNSYIIIHKKNRLIEAPKDEPPIYYLSALKHLSSKTKNALYTMIINDENAPLLLKEWVLHEQSKKKNAKAIDYSELEKPKQIAQFISSLDVTIEDDYIEIYQKKNRILTVVNDTSKIQFSKPHNVNNCLVGPACLALVYCRDIPAEIRAKAIRLLHKNNELDLIKQLAFLLHSPLEEISIKVCILKALLASAEQNSNIIFPIFNALLLDATVSKKIKKEILHYLIKASETDVAVIILLQKMIGATPKAYHGTSNGPDFLACEALHTIAQQHKNRRANIIKILKTLYEKSPAEGFPTLSKEKILKYTQDLDTSYYPIFDESSDPDISGSDSDATTARENALFHIKAIIYSLKKPTPDEVVEKFTTATTLVRDDLHKGTGRNASAIDQKAELSNKSKKAVAEVAKIQAQATCRHNPILRQALTKARKKIFSSNRKNIGGNVIGDEQGRIIDRDKLEINSNAVYKDVRDAMPAFIKSEFLRLRDKYKINAADFDTKEDYQCFKTYCARQLTLAQDSFAIHHILYKEMYPETAVSTRNLMSVTNGPRTPTKDRPAGTHAYMHSLTAIKEPLSMRVSAPQVQEALGEFTTRARAPKKGIPFWAIEDKGYEADTESPTKRVGHLTTCR